MLLASFIRRSRGVRRSGGRTRSSTRARRIRCSSGPRRRRRKGSFEPFFGRRPVVEGETSAGRRTKRKKRKIGVEEAVVKHNRHFRRRSLSGGHW